MRKYGWRPRLAAAACLALVGGWLGMSAFADEAKKGGAGDDDAEVSEGARAVAAIGLAHDLIEYGRKHKLPEALITAARILHATPADADKGDSEGAEKALDPINVLTEARTLVRPKDEAVLALIEKAEEELKEKSRQVLAGARQISETLGAGQSITKMVTIKGTTHIHGSARKPPITQTRKIPRLEGVPPKVKYTEQKFTIPAGPAENVVVEVLQGAKVIEADRANPNVNIRFSAGKIRHLKQDIEKIGNFTVRVTNKGSSAAQVSLTIH